MLIKNKYLTGVLVSCIYIYKEMNLNWTIETMAMYTFQCLINVIHTEQVPVRMVPVQYMLINITIKSTEKIISLI